MGCWQVQRGASGVAAGMCQMPAKDQLAARINTMQYSAKQVMAPFRSLDFLIWLLLSAVEADECHG